jgi:hypothetical protein
MLSPHGDSKTQSWQIIRFFCCGKKADAFLYACLRMHAASCSVERKAAILPTKIQIYPMRCSQPVQNSAFLAVYFSNARILILYAVCAAQQSGGISYFSLKEAGRSKRFSKNDYLCALIAAVAT